MMPRPMLSLLQRSLILLLLKVIIALAENTKY